MNRRKEKIDGLFLNLLIALLKAHWFLRRLSLLTSIKILASDYWKECITWLYPEFCGRINERWNR